MVHQGLTTTRAKAQALILSGKVNVGGKRIDKPGTPILPNTPIQISAGPRFVSRGGDKLAAALDYFGIVTEGKVVLDIGASTGGFTDCLLQYGAKKVYALDVGHGQLDPKIRHDPRVVVMEKTNIRYVDPTLFDETIDLVTIDISFISLTKVLPKVKAILHRGLVLALIKPQFEVGPRHAPKGIVRDPAQHQTAIDRIAHAAIAEGFQVKGTLVSPLIGAKGNREFFMELSQSGNQVL